MSSDTMPTDTRVRGLCNLSAIQYDSKEWEPTLKRAIELTRLDTVPNNNAPYIRLVIKYKESRRYSDALVICDERLTWISRNAQCEYSDSLKGGYLAEKIECLYSIGRVPEAIALLDEAKRTVDISDQYKSMFNSREYVDKLRGTHVRIDPH